MSSYCVRKIVGQNITETPASQKLTFHMHITISFF